MIGIITGGACVPKWRLALNLLSQGASGERSVAGPDEDSVTMAVAAVLDCLKGVDRSRVDGLFFATTTSPFAEKQMAVLIAKAAGLKENIMTADLTGSLKSGTTAIKLAADAIKAGSARQVVVVAADCRLGAPGSEHERNGGDGAAALLLGGDEVAVALESSVSVAQEIFDVWRSSEERFLNSWENRFDLQEGYMRTTREAVRALMKGGKWTAEDFARVVLYSPDPRVPAALAKDLGFDPARQLQDPLWGVLGNTGTASPLLLLLAALETVQAGDRILLTGYGSGSDALAFKVTDHPGPEKNQGGVARQLQSKRMVPDYLSYLKWRGLVPGEAQRLPYSVTYASGSAIFRERERIFSLEGSRCKGCGAIQYPPQRICVKCQAKDHFESVRLADRKGKIFTASQDPITGELIGLVNLEGGGRLFVNLSDGDLSEFPIDGPVEMSFRKLRSLPGDQIRNYFWKAIPLRNNG